MFCYHSTSMALEYEKITRQLPEQYVAGGEVVRGVVRTLVDLKMLPLSLENILDQRVSALEFRSSEPTESLPKFVFVRSKSSDPDAFEIDALGLEYPLRNILIAVGITQVEALNEADLAVLLRAPGFKPQYLISIKAKIDRFSRKVEEERERWILLPDEPVELDFPSAPLNPERILQSIEFVREEGTSPYVTELDALDIPTRVRNALDRHNITTLRDLLSASDEELLSFRNVGDGSLSETHEAIDRFMRNVIQRREEQGLAEDRRLAIVLPKKPLVEKSASYRPSK